VLSYKNVQAVTGLTSRVYELFQMLDERSKDDPDVRKMKSLALENNPDADPKILVGDDISFQDVDLYSPTGVLLVEGLTFTVSRRTNVLVSGPNGSGKSSLFRVLGGLWPLCSGTLTKPATSQLFYVPQNPYLTPGTLRQQITYPKQVDTDEQDEDLQEILSWVGLDYLPVREGGWNTTKEWMDVCSGGEKQRLAMARLFYHQPEFGILDECTSAVSIDIESHIYEKCRELGITIFTVSHRPQLKHHHDFELAFDGEGGWTWSSLGDE